MKDGATGGWMNLCVADSIGPLTVMRRHALRVRANAQINVGIVCLVVIHGYIQVWYRRGVFCPAVLLWAGGVKRAGGQLHTAK
jgi:hypothetical protein